MENVAIIGSVFVSAMGAVFGLYQARKADRSATTTKTIEIGVTTLIDQYQEANKDLRENVEKLTVQVKDQEKKIHNLEREVEDLKTIVDNKDAEIIRLKRELGEL